MQPLAEWKKKKRYVSYYNIRQEIIIKYRPFLTFLHASAV